MSKNARRFKNPKRRCCPCGERALHYSPSRRRRRWAPDHPLCGRCYASVMDCMQARRRAVGVRPKPASSLPPVTASVMPERKPVPSNVETVYPARRTSNHE